MVPIDEWHDPGDRGVILSFSEERTEGLIEIYEDDQAQDLSGVSLQFKVTDAHKFSANLPEGASYDGPK